MVEIVQVAVDEAMPDPVKGRRDRPAVRKHTAGSAERPIGREATQYSGFVITRCALVSHDQDLS
ncbi:hypothetical protein [Methylobacterium nigriterrae]|uniref:hypothetical protein n=1 Tax=Methylobacterium nigriterrae TaxID=3127512 RepID=UPI0030132EE5